MEGYVFLEHFSSIKDFRQPGKVTYQLTDIIFLTIAAVIAGADSYEDVELFGRLKIDWLQSHNGFENGIPSWHTISRVMSLIDPKRFQKCFVSWMDACQKRSKGRLIAIDGKTLRSSYNRDSKDTAIHMVSAFCVENQQMLGQLKTADHSNEITAILELIELLDMRESLVTIDAMGCQTDIAEKIVNKGGDYLFQVKGNQPKLKEAFEKELPAGKILSMEESEKDAYETIETGHGREEIRQYFIFEPMGELKRVYGHWAGVKKVGVSISFRKKSGDEVSSYSVRYYITSADIDARRFGEAARKHWGIESVFHWTLDVSFREDDCQKYVNNSAENFSYIRRTALNLIKRDKETKGSVRNKRKRAGWAEECLATVLSGLGFLCFCPARIPF